MAYDGTRYGLTYTAGNRIEIKSAATLGGLKEAKAVVVYQPEKGTMRSENLWAPEFFRDGAQWCVLYAADDGNDANHRLYLLRSKGRDVRGPYDFVGQVPISGSTWAIDGFYFRHQRRLYLVWSGRARMSDPQRLYIRRMKDPVTPLGEAVVISEPTFDWERIGWPVNEGPALIAHGKAVTLTYSAAGGSTRRYCLGRLFNPSGALMNPAAWQKSANPIFASDGGMYAPGHNSFFQAKNGSWWNVFHAKERDEEGWGGRIAALQPVSFSKAGEVLLGSPTGWTRAWREPR